MLGDHGLLQRTDGVVDELGVSLAAPTPDTCHMEEGGEANLQ